MSAARARGSSPANGGRTPVRCLLVPVEVARRLLLEPEPVVLGRLLQELRRLLEDVLAVGLVIGGGGGPGGPGPAPPPGGGGPRAPRPRRGRPPPPPPEEPAPGVLPLPAGA